MKRADISHQHGAACNCVQPCSVNISLPCRSFSALSSMSTTNRHRRNLHLQKKLMRCWFSIRLCCHLVRAMLRNSAVQRAGGYLLQLLTLSPSDANRSRVPSAHQCRSGMDRCTPRATFGERPEVLGNPKSQYARPHLLRYRVVHVDDSDSM
ncbi:hypothetical protein EXIGLDRAFT_518668 [Exidia glandulosa HHB12029]|uniref:Uncharacterized protein n=1 Tax=Exidia glandulosa HHB12029 TaxID=1314781 RepID=A0A166ARA0_EXIGL|nr:hypothetical protein EXIGLDRAFT_518668 [Exidia glandulosa HHB12029]